MTVSPTRRAICKQPEGEPCVSFGKRGPCRLCTDTSKISERMKALNADPEFKAKMAALNADPEFKAAARPAPPPGKGE